MKRVNIYQLTDDINGYKRGDLFEEHCKDIGMFREAGTEKPYFHIPHFLRVWTGSYREKKPVFVDMLLPTDAQERKGIPITTGVLDYFPLAIAEVAKCSWAGNQQHHPGEVLHWDKTKSTDHADCISRHLIDRGKFDSDGKRHSAKLAWRALALLQIELEEDLKKGN